MTPTAAPWRNRVAMKRRGLLLAGIVLVAAPGCSWRQAYDSGQAWQRNECNRIPEQGERERCLSRTTSTYDDYRRERATQ